MKGRRGRPKLPEGAARAAVLTLRMAPDEKQAIEEAAEAAGVGVSEWAREMLMGAAEAAYIIPRLAEAIRKMHGAEASFVEVAHVTDESVATGGDVYVFDIEGNPMARRAYAWSAATEGGKRRFVAVLHAGPVTSPEAAVRAAQAAQAAKN